MPLKIADIFSFGAAPRKASPYKISGPVELMNPGIPRTTTVRRANSRKSRPDAPRVTKSSNSSNVPTVPDRRRLSNANAARLGYYETLYPRNNETAFLRRNLSMSREAAFMRRSSMFFASATESRGNSLNGAGKPAVPAKDGIQSRKGSGSSRTQPGSSGSTKGTCFKGRRRNESIVAAMIAEIHLDLEGAETRIAVVDQSEDPVTTAKLTTTETDHLQAIKPSAGLGGERQQATDVGIPSLKLVLAGNNNKNNNMIKIKSSGATPGMYFGDYKIKESHVTETELRVEDDSVSPISPMPSPFPGLTTVLVELKQQGTDDEAPKGKEDSRTTLTPDKDELSGKIKEIFDSAWRKSLHYTQLSDSWDSKLSFSSSTITIGIDAETASYSRNASVNTTSASDFNGYGDDEEDVGYGVDLFPPMSDEKRISMTWKLLWNMRKSQRDDYEEDSPVSETPDSQIQSYSYEGSSLANYEFPSDNLKFSDLRTSRETSQQQQQHYQETLAETSILNLGSFQNNFYHDISERAEPKAQTNFRRQSLLSATWTRSKYGQYGQLPGNKVNAAPLASDTYDIDHIIASYMYT